MTRTLSHPPAISLDDVQHFVLEDASWELYEKLLRDVGSRPIRITYDNGRLEMMAPLPGHEDVKKLVGRMIEMLTFILDMPMKSLGSTTFRRKDRAKGLEPDECYYFKNEAKMRGRKRLDMRKDPPPELVVEIDITHRSIPREPIYAALGVAEIWRFDGLRLQCLHLEKDCYAARKMSIAFPFLEPALLQQFIERLNHQEETSILKEFVAWVKKNGWTAP
ncbi:MAG TPA: Uma2 family endonuclease [Tepidisphaeraceae bacterium]|jgi:Uma2 family endonuclease|nr:Uma2 family endonuclease [Tepidisphaeraceae bacterium]